MPIKNLNRNRQSPGLARAGIIRLGYKARKCANKRCGRITEPLDQGPNCPACGRPLPDSTFPREAAHFVLTDAPGVADVLGKQTPTELRIYFPFDEVDRVFPHYMKLRSASSMLCQGDGEHIIYAIDQVTGIPTVRDGVAVRDFSEGRLNFAAGEVMACPGIDRDLYPKCAKCKPSATLIVMLRDIPRLAYYQITTGSLNNILDIPDQLDYVREQVRRLTGEARITGVPFILRRVKRTTSAPKVDEHGNQIGRQRTDKWFLELEIEPEWVARMVRGISRLADPLRAVAALPAQVSQPNGQTTYSAGPVDELDDFDADLVDGEVIAETEGEAEAGEDQEATESPAENSQAPAGKNGKAERPLQPAQLMEFLQRRAGNNGGQPTKQQTSLLASKLEEAFAGSGSERKKRLAVLKLVWGVNSAKELTAGQVKATLDWLLTGQQDSSGDYPLHRHAPEEARRLWEAAQEQPAGEPDQPPFDDYEPPEWWTEEGGDVAEAAGEAAADEEPEPVQFAMELQTGESPQTTSTKSFYSEGD